MSGLPTPDGDKGFGRVLLEYSLPIRGKGPTAMFVDDRAVALAGVTTDYVVTASEHLVTGKRGNGTERGRSLATLGVANVSHN